MFRIKSRNTLRDRYPEAKTQCIVQPCVTDVSAFQSSFDLRDHIRSEYGLTDRLVFSFLGSLAWYQLPEAGLRWFKLLAQQVTGVHLLAVTRELEEFKKLANEIGIDKNQMTIVSARPQEVPRLMNAADVGILLRDDSIVNRVASPVKFAEYLASGVPVLISRNVGDCTELVQREDVGFVVDALPGQESETQRVIGWLESLRNNREAYRKRCQEVAKAQFDWHQILPARVDLIHELVQANLTFGKWQ